MQKIVAFHSNQLGIRGTEVALYDYADFNESLLGNKSIIIAPIGAEQSHPEGEKKFRQRFDVQMYEHPDQLPQIIKSYGADVFYALKAGLADDIVCPSVKTVVHAVFKYYQPHGDVYAYISDWLSKAMSMGKSPVVPHIVNLPEVHDNMRVQLGIPQQSIVYGRYGGYQTFDMEFVKHAVYEVALSNPNVFFIFMNTANFIKSRIYNKKWKDNILKPLFYPEKILPNVIFLPGTTDMVEKTKFINTCDAMLHARSEGETFGLACGEFSIKNKPVITCDHPRIGDRAHIDMLGKKGIYYTDKKSLKDILQNFPIDPARNWDAYSANYNPDSVMHQFENVFLQPSK